jgi:large subunit ribosomal protein L25
VPEHVDFFAVRMDEKMKATVAVMLRGESPTAKSTDLMLQQPLTSVQVEGLPGALPEAIAVDVSGLEEVDQAIHARELHLPEGVTLLTDPDELVVKVAMTRAALEPVTSEAAAETSAEQAADEAATADAASSDGGQAS